jgi:hypothetical protein
MNAVAATNLGHDPSHFCGEEKDGHSMLCPYKGQLLDYGMTAVAWLEKELSRPLESTAVVT